MIIFTFYYSRYFDRVPEVDSVTANNLFHAIMQSKLYNNSSWELTHFSEFDGKKLTVKSGKPNAALAG